LDPSGEGNVSKAELLGIQAMSKGARQRVLLNTIEILKELACKHHNYGKKNFGRDWLIHMVAC